MTNVHKHVTFCFLREEKNYTHFCFIHRWYLYHNYFLPQTFENDISKSSQNFLPFITSVVLAAVYSTFDLAGLIFRDRKLFEQKW